MLFRGPRRTERDPGLDCGGGEFTAAKRAAGYELMLHEVRWTEDLAASGRIDWPGRGGVVHADLEVRTGDSSGHLELTWPEGVSEAHAAAHGTLGGKAIAAEAPAP